MIVSLNAWTIGVMEQPGAKIDAIFDFLIAEGLV